MYNAVIHIVKSLYYQYSPKRHDTLKQKAARPSVIYSEIYIHVTLVWQPETAYC